MSVYIGREKGKTYPFRTRIAVAWKGLQVYRSPAKNTQQKKSSKQSTVTSRTTIYANRFRDILSDSQRNAWDQYAGTLGSAVDRERSDNTTTAKNIIPRRKKLMSGINAFVGTHIAGFLAGKTDTMDNPPIGEHVPPPPSNVAVSYLTGTVTVTWTPPTFVGSPIFKKVRIWAMFQGGAKIHAQLVGYAAPADGTFTFTALHTGHAWGSPSMNLTSIGQGIIRVQMDSLVERIADQAPMLGPSSNVAELKITN